MATLQVTVPDPQVARIQAAFGKRFGFVDGNDAPRDATSEEVRQALVNYLIENVRYVEVQEAAETARSGIGDVGAT